MIYPPASYYSLLYPPLPLPPPHVQAAAFAVGTLFLLRIVEPVYGSRGVLKFLLCVLAATGATTFALALVLYLASQDQARAGALL